MNNRIALYNALIFMSVTQMNLKMNVDMNVLMDLVLYAQLITLLDIYERKKDDCWGCEDYVYYLGACDALKKLKEKIDKGYE